jgi:MtaA/CmuA family methyltransferase
MGPGILTGVEAMIARERVEAALRRERPDRVPVFLRDLTLGLDVCGYTTPEVCDGGPGGYDAFKSAHAVIRTQQALGHDCVVGCIHGLGRDIESIGGRVEYPEYGIPFVAEHPFADPSQIGQVQLPALRTESRAMEVARSHSLVVDCLGDDVAVAANVEGPVTQAGILRGLDALLLDMVRQPDRAQAVVDFAVALSCEQIRLLAEAGAHFIFIAAASDGPSAIRPEHYLRYTVPGLTRIVATASEMGVPVVFHPHGPFTQERFHYLVEAAIETGIIGFQFGENNDLRLAKQQWGDRVCILGGPDIPEVLLPGPPEQIARVTREIIEAAGFEGGFVLMPSCSVHRGFPLDHLRAMIEVAHGTPL